VTTSEDLMTLDLSSLGWDEHFCSAYRRHDRPDQEPARVTVAERGVCAVLAAAGPTRVSVGGALLVAAVADPVRLPVPGDWVVLRSWGDGRSSLEAVLPRRTALIDGQGALAANVDTAAVVVAAEPRPDPARVARLLALARESGAAPVVLVTKVDLAARPAALMRAVTELAEGAPVYGVSATRRIGLAPVQELVGPGRTLGLLGDPGSGKSALVDALAGATVLSTRALVPLAGGGQVIDTPGPRAMPATIALLR
jgi:ribosome biogenesis GTPase / thiamine phosphate phosphatase